MLNANQILNHKILLVLGVTLTLSTMAEEFFEGENLLTPYDLDSEKWEVLTNVEDSFKSMIWKSKEKGMADMYVVNIQGGNKSKLKRVRKIQDDPGRKACQKFESLELEPIPNKNYKSIMWRTVCTNGEDFKAQILHLAIKGQDSIYHLQKIWRGEVLENDMKSWISTFKKVYVCDTRKEEKLCPTEYKRVNIQ